MNENNASQIRDRLNEVYRQESRSIFATLIRLIGDFDLAEEAMHEAFAVAVKQWLRDGIPANPRAWLVSVGRFKAIDPTFSRLFKTKNNIYEKRLRETAKLDFVYH